MYGLEAISAANGWSMALAGTLIVLSGLTILSFVISQLHNLIALFKKRASGDTEAAELSSVTVEETVRIDDRDLIPIEAATSAYGLLIERLEQPFELKSLYTLAKENNFPHEHLTIKSLREAAKLIPQGEGLFAWNPHGTPVVEQPVSVAAAVPAPTVPSAPAPAVPEPATPTPAPTPERPSYVEGETVTAPMPGMIVRYEKQVGDAVSEGETVVILEAMKMENALPSSTSGTVKSINFSSGDAVAKGDILCVIE